MTRPFFPAPLTPEVLATLTIPVHTFAEAEDQQGRISAFRDQVSAEIDDIETQIQHNHADYLGGRPSWSYEDRIQTEALLKHLRRQRQHLQELFGRANRRVRHLEAAERGTPKNENMTVATAFVNAAEQLLDPETFALLMDLAKARTMTPIKSL